MHKTAYAHLGAYVHVAVFIELFVSPVGNVRQHELGGRWRSAPDLAEARLRMRRRMGVGDSLCIRAMPAGDGLL